MGKITNEDLYVGEIASVIRLPTNQYNRTIYDDSFGDHDEAVIQSHFQPDSGCIPKAVEDDLASLKDAAQKTLSQRKPIINWKTKNVSFIEVHNDLRRLGIKNNTFFLKLYDRDLVGVDPHSPVLPLELQIKVYLECVINPWFFLREVARIPADGMPIEPGGGIAYILDRNNLATWYLFIHNIDNYSSKPRQCGKTQDALLKLNYAYHFGASSSTILFFNKDISLSKENLARLKDQRDLMPAYLQMRVAFDDDGNTIKGVDNITTMKNPVTSNQIKVMPSATSKEMATRLGRGYTSSLMMFDEFDFTNYNTEILNSSVFAYSTASKNAIENHSMAGRLFLSTPGDLGTRDGKTATDFIRGTKEVKGMLIWDDHMLDDPIEDIKAQIYSPNYNGVVFVEHDWKMLKRSETWYERQCNLCGYNQEVILREIQLQRLSGSSASPFSREQQIYLSSHKQKPIGQIDVRTVDTMSTIYLYEKFNRKIPYILGIDPSEGLSEDNNAMIVINPYTLKVAAEYKCPYISPKDMSELIVNFMDERCPNGLIVVESNRGHGLLARLMESPYQHRIWYDNDRLNQLLSVKTDKYGGMPQSVLARKVQGFVTGTKSRNLLFQLLEEMMKESISCIFSTNLVDEILTLIRKPTTGKIEAAPGEHDDCVMAYLIGLYVYLNSTNLDEYGIVRRSSVEAMDAKPERESEMAYRQRVQSALPIIPDKYRGIFEDFLNAKDPVSDARDYARDLRRHEINEGNNPFFSMSSHPYQADDGTDSFDAVYTSEEDQKLGMEYRAINQNHRVYNGNSRDEMLPDSANYMRGDEREGFERSIFESNYEGRNDVFNPDDWV